MQADQLIDEFRSDIEASPGTDAAVQSMLRPMFYTATQVNATHKSLTYVYGNVRKQNKVLESLQNDTLPRMQDTMNTLSRAIDDKAEIKQIIDGLQSRVMLLEQSLSFFLNGKRKRDDDDSEVFTVFKDELEEIYAQFPPGSVVEYKRSGEWQGEGVVVSRKRQPTLVEVIVNWGIDTRETHTLFPYDEFLRVKNQQ